VSASLLLNGRKKFAKPLTGRKNKTEPIEAVKIVQNGTYVCMTTVVSSSLRYSSLTHAMFAVCGSIASQEGKKERNGGAGKNPGAGPPIPCIPLETQRNYDRNYQTYHYHQNILPLQMGCEMPAQCPPTNLTQ
jgi:hypothetical protein